MSLVEDTHSHNSCQSVSLLLMEDNEPTRIKDVGISPPLLSCYIPKAMESNMSLTLCVPACCKGVYATWPSSLSIYTYSPPYTTMWWRCSHVYDFMVSGVLTYEDDVFTEGIGLLACIIG